MAYLIAYYARENSQFTPEVTADTFERVLR